MNVNDRSGFDVPLKVSLSPLNLLSSPCCLQLVKIKRGAGSWGLFVHVLQYSYTAVFHFFSPNLQWKNPPSSVMLMDINE